MDKLYAIKIRQSDGTYGAAIPVSVLAENVDWNSTLSLVDILGQVDTSESIQDQINSLKNTKATQASVNALDQKVDNAVEYITHNSEIADAREGVDGTEYSTLKERLDNEYENLKNIIIQKFDTVAQMKADTTLIDGTYIQTGGYHVVNDGGSALYKIVNTQPSTYYELLNNGLYAKFIFNNFVSPEQFGAYGDGITDDSNAWQSALNTGIPLKAFGKKYYINTTLLIKNNSIIDCNYAEFIVGTSVLFNANNEVVSQLTGSTMNANTFGYNTGNNGFNGYCVLTGTNNPLPFREDTKAGFVAKVDNGIIYETFPVDIINPTLYFYKYFTFTIRNIGNVIFSNPVNAVVITASNCYNCLIENIESHAFYGYSFIRLHKCRNSRITNVILNNTFNSNNEPCYPIIISESSYTTISNCDISNQYWHCITTSSSTNGIMTCYTIIEKCKLTSNQQFSYLDHVNTFGTRVINSTLSSVCLHGLSTIKNCVINQYSGHRSKIRIVANPSDALSKYSIENIVFYQESSSYASTTGIELFGMNLGNTVSNFTFVEIKNIYCNESGSILFSLTENGKYALGNISIKNIKNFLIQMLYENVTVSASNYYFEITDCYDRNKLDISGKFRFIFICNSHIKKLSGTFYSLRINNVIISNTLNDISGTEFNGANIKSTISNSAILNFANINISQIGDYIFIKDLQTEAGHRYYSYTIDSTGAIIPTRIVNS